MIGATDSNLIHRRHAPHSHLTLPWLPLPRRPAMVAAFRNSVSCAASSGQHQQQQASTSYAATANRAPRAAAAPARRAGRASPPTTGRAASTVVSFQNDGTASMPLPGMRQPELLPGAFCGVEAGVGGAEKQADNSPLVRSPRLNPPPCMHIPAMSPCIASQRPLHCF